jgi:hypothetical protein
LLRTPLPKQEGAGYEQEAGSDAGNKTRHEIPRKQGDPASQG